ncbi:hypothetical protein [Arthrobacter sp. Br18]|uniref:hypothetical protein n=1 Tax=Arthrobacter sp. Br18 TaxID=1312954 RepID=UPI0004ACCEC2|nr:hypothetical protein [Arthrobacter sp. Br18]
MSIRTDTGLSDALDCSAGVVEEVQDGLHDGPGEPGAAGAYLRDAAWAGHQWY